MPLRVFPVASEGAPHFSDDFGYVKPGATKGHQGNDIFAARGTAVLAPDDGALTLTTDPLGGLVFYLKAADGVTYYGAHLDSQAGAARTVHAGDVVGAVGTTGNAHSTSPHLHFEVHPGGGAPVDPFNLLSALTPQPAGGASPVSPFDAADGNWSTMVVKIDQAGELLAADLQHYVTGALSTTWLGDAIAAYQDAGAYGVATVAPSIDGAGASSATSPITQQAWTLNGQLAALPTSGSFGTWGNQLAEQTANQAHALASQMVALYNQAIAAGKAALAAPNPPGPPPPPPGRPDLSGFATISPSLAGKAVIAAYLAKHPDASFAPIDKLSLALAWALGPEGSFSHAYLGSNNWGSYHATKAWIAEHQNQAGYGILAFMDHAPAPYIAGMQINPSPEVGAAGFLALVERDVGDWSTLADPQDFATRLYVAGYYGGFHPNVTPVAQRAAAAKAGTLTADDKANIADGAAGVTRALPAAQYALAAGLNEPADPAAIAVGPPFASLAERLTVAHPPHTLDHARQLLAGATMGLSLADALAAPGGDGVWLFASPAQPEPQASSSGGSSAGAWLAAAAATVLGVVVYKTAGG